MVADTVKSARLRAGISQAELAKRIGTGQRGITRLETGEGNATIGTLERVATATKSVLDIKIRPKKA